MLPLCDELQVTKRAISHDRGTASAPVTQIYRGDHQKKLNSPSSIEPFRPIRAFPDITWAEVSGKEHTWEWGRWGFAGRSEYPDGITRVP